MSQVYTIGEATFDIIFKDSQPVDAKVGGSVLNTAVSLGRLGVLVSFISAFGNDQVGDMAMDFLQKNNISTDCIHRFEGSSRIALAFLDQQNNAHYSFYNAVGKSVLKFPQVKENDIILFGSSHAVRDDIRKELISFLKDAHLKKAIIVYDPNFRKSQLPQLASLKPKIEENISLAHVLKGSDEDFLSIFGANPSKTFEIIQEFSNAVLICTANKNGINVHTKTMNKHYTVPAIQPVSTIGAGDTFSAGIIYSLFKQKASVQSLHKLSDSFWDNLANTSTQFAQHVCLSYDNYLSADFVKKLTIK
jgi:fructokinase